MESLILNPFVAVFLRVLCVLCATLLLLCLLERRRVLRRLTAPENPRLTAHLIRNLFLN